MLDTAIEAVKQTMNAELRLRIRMMANVLVASDYVTVLSLRDDCFVETQTLLKGGPDA